MSHGGLLSLRLAAVELAALLVRAAGNVATGGRADEAPEPRSPALDRALRAIERELARGHTRSARPWARRRRRAPSRRGAACAGLRANAPRDRVDRQRRRTGPTLRAAREAWLVLATHEYVAVAAIDSQLDVPTCASALEALTGAIVEGAANVRLRRAARESPRRVSTPQRVASSDGRADLRA